MTSKGRSGCPISLSLELLGDRWTLLIIRDLAFAGKRHFREFLQSDEGISSRTLAERLQTLVDFGRRPIIRSSRRHLDGALQRDD